jgi:hypothetical protein
MGISFAANRSGTEERTMTTLQAFLLGMIDGWGQKNQASVQAYLQAFDIDHSRTKTKSPQTNGICERFHKTVLNEFYRVAFRKKVYRSIDHLQADLDGWIRQYNETGPHQGRGCFGKTPTQTLLDAMPMTKEKMIAA